MSTLHAVVALVVLTLLAAATGCSEQSASAPPVPPPSQPNPTPSKAATPAPKAPPPFDSKTFCDAVFAPADLEPHVGPNLIPVPANARRSSANAVQCGYQRVGSDQRAELVVSLAVNCRPNVQDEDSLRKIYRQLGSDGDGNYRELDLGKVAFYAHKSSLSIYQLAIVTEPPTCTITVSTNFLARDTVEPIARQVMAKLTPELLPLPSESTDNQP